MVEPNCEILVSSAVASSDCVFSENFSPAYPPTLLAFSVISSISCSNPRNFFDEILGFN